MPRLTLEAQRIKTAPSPLSAFLRRIAQRLAEDLDAVIVITGTEGEGKSTLGWIFCHNVHSGFHWKEQIAWDPISYVDAAVNTPPGYPLMFDEAVAGLYNRNSMRKENRQLNEFLYICRERNLAHFFCFPRFDSFDITIREHRAWAWIRILRRGKAEIRMRNWNMEVGETLEEQLQAFPLVAKCTWDAVESENFKKYQEEKSLFVKRVAREITGESGTPEKVIERSYEGSMTKINIKKKTHDRLNEDKPKNLTWDDYLHQLIDQAKESRGHG